MSFAFRAGQVQEKRRLVNRNRHAHLTRDKVDGILILSRASQSPQVLTLLLQDAHLNLLRGSLCSRPFSEALCRVPSMDKLLH